jgi:hypothetical protein
VVNTTLKPYALLDLYSSYAFSNKLRCFIDLRNITNSKFIEISGFRTMGCNQSVGIICWL